MGILAVSDGNPSGLASERAYPCMPGRWSPRSWKGGVEVAPVAMMVLKVIDSVRARGVALSGTHPEE